MPESPNALSTELLDAMIAVLDEEVGRADPGSGGRLLRVASATMEAWRRGRLTTEQAIVLLRAAITTAEP